MTGWPVAPSERKAALDGLDDATRTEVARWLPGVGGGVAESPLLLAVRADDLHRVSELLVGRADANDGGVSGETPLIRAVASSHIDVVAVLLLHSADPSRKTAAGRAPADVARGANIRTLCQVFRGDQVETMAKNMALCTMS